MNELQAITGTVAALKAAADLGKVIYSAKIDADTKQRVGHLLDLIFDAREKAFSAQDDLATVKQRVADCESELMRLKQWGEDKKRYKLFKPNTMNVVVLGISSISSNGEPAHYLCTSCYQRHTKSILNIKEFPGKKTAFLCPVCSVEFESAHRGTVIAEFAPD